MKFLTSKEKKELLNKIIAIYECNNFIENAVVALSGKEEKIWLMSREVAEFDYGNLRLNSAGIYFGRFDNEKLRMSIEGAQIVGKSAKKNLAIISQEDAQNFIRGQDLLAEKEISCEEGQNVIVLSESTILGVSKYKSGSLLSVLPKNRKIVNKI